MAALYLCFFQLAVYALGAGVMVLVRHADSSPAITGDQGALNPDTIDGGGWTLVRCVSAAEGTWHPATDNLRGTDEYGTFSADYAAADATFSVPWDVDTTSAYLFGYSDLSMWLECATATVFELGAPTSSEVLQSSASDEPYAAEWYIRSGNTEDPWVSVFDHGAADPGMVYGEASKGGHMEHLGVGGLGACVWVR
jgi:hypothetical protein